MAWRERYQSQRTALVSMERRQIVAAYITRGLSIYISVTLLLAPLFKSTINDDWLQSSNGNHCKHKISPPLEESWPLLVSGLVYRYSLEPLKLYPCHINHFFFTRLVLMVPSDFSRTRDHPSDYLNSTPLIWKGLFFSFSGTRMNSPRVICYHCTRLTRTIPLEVFYPTNIAMDRTAL